MDGAGGQSSRAEGPRPSQDGDSSRAPVKQPAAAVRVGAFPAGKSRRKAETGEACRVKLIWVVALLQWVCILSLAPDLSAREAREWATGLQTRALGDLRAHREEKRRVEGSRQG
ncbi:hypothetical protein NDU88_010945 [Pleurodeles waltl]|uniref:Uncharacterized protein n=1 Tax=Pleurodeles waltl TaxID=8319 RepID=A0AAV7R1N5_PLEWA|nr:hypothetical protein NDU88_010945 [Pleurodeles waltl]